MGGSVAVVVVAGVSPRTMGVGAIRCCRFGTEGVRQDSAMVEHMDRAGALREQSMPDVVWCGQGGGQKTPRSVEEEEKREPRDGFRKRPSGTSGNA